MTLEEMAKKRAEEMYGVNYMDFEHTQDGAFRAMFHYKAGARDMIKKACEWLESVNLDYYEIREGVFSKELVEDFSKAMED